MKHISILIILIMFTSCMYRQENVLIIDEIRKGTNGNYEVGFKNSRNIMNTYILYQIGDTLITVKN